MTANEFLEKGQFNPDEGISFEKYHGDQTTYICQQAMIAFAVFHVEQALKSASENAKTNVVSEYEVIINKESILNSYPLDNIK